MEVIKINKAICDPSALNVYAYLSPHPLDEDSMYEADELNWIPGFDGSERGEDGIHPLMRDENIALYERVEQLAADGFCRALQNLWPLLDGYLINSLQIAIDVTGILLSRSTLAAYNFVQSQPEKGNYIFNMTQYYLQKELHYAGSGKAPDLKHSTTWEHEIIHLLDHAESLKASVYRGATSAAECLKYYVLQYRTEGIAELYYLLKGGVEEIRTLAAAREKFKANLSAARQLCQGEQELNEEQQRNLFKTYDFYELGPWIVLDQLRTVEGGWYSEFIESVIEKVERGEIVEHEDILKVISISLRIKSNDIFENINFI